jgi:hypothetical protein
MLRLHLPFAAPALGLATAALLCLNSAASAQIRNPEGTTYTDGKGMTHWYQVVATPNGVTWGQAARQAAAMGGYLATIDSAAENQVVFGLIDKVDYWHFDILQNQWMGPWIGGTQLSKTSEPSGGWGWTELESFAFNAWAPGQPDNASQADAIHYGGEAQGRSATWSDSPSTTRMRGFVVEWSGATSPITVGLRRDEPGSFDGYTLLAPLRSTLTYLVDNRGRRVHFWPSQYIAGLQAYLQDDGSIIRSGWLNNTNFAIGGAGGIVERIDWNGNVTWSWQYSSPTEVLHHDIEVLPNGNILMIAWETKTVAEAIAAGRDPKLLPDGRLLPDKIIEVQPSGTNGGTIVWEWSPWDHLIQDFDSSKANYGNVAAHPERIDINYAINDGEDDWMHSNAIDYNAKLDQIVLSVRSFDEIWIIDHSTTTAEAKTGSGGRSGKGGRLLYRWGNPLAYRAGTAQDQQLFKQHDSHWIEEGRPGAGNILLFNNGTGRPGGNASSADEIVLPTPDSSGNYPMGSNGRWGPEKPTWSYMTPNPTDWYSQFISGAQRQPNGTTLICGGWLGTTFEVTPNKEVIWEYQNPIEAGAVAQQGSDSYNLPFVFRAYRYEKTHPAFQSRNLAPEWPVEDYTDVLLAEGSKLPYRVSLGRGVDLQLRSTQNAGNFYLLGTSMTPGMIPIDNRYLRISFDPLLELSMFVGVPSLFKNYMGSFDATGNATAKFHVPALPFLLGTEWATAFIVLDPNSRTGFGTISNTVRAKVVQ